MYEWLNNAWVIGIGASIISGPIVSYITRLIFKNKDNAEYLQKINAANREVVYAIRPSIPEGMIPTDNVFTALIDATARRYGLKTIDLYSSTEISQELIKEVMDSNFISADTKEKYCKKLLSISTGSQEMQDNSEKDHRSVLEISREEHLYKERVLKMFSAVIGISTSVMTAVLVIAYNKDQVAWLSSEYNIIAVLLPITAMLSVSIAVWVVSSIRRRQIEQREIEMRSSLPQFWAGLEDYTLRQSNKDRNSFK